MLEWEIKLSQKPCQFSICHCLCFFAACEWGPSMQGFQRPAGADGVCDSPPAPSPSVLLCPGHAFLAFFGRLRARGRGCTCTFQLRCRCRGCYSPQQEPRSKQDGGSPRQLFSTVPLPLSTWLGIFSVLSDRVWRVAVACVCLGWFLSLPLYPAVSC